MVRKPQLLSQLSLALMLFVAPLAMVSSSADASMLPSAQQLEQHSSDSIPMSLRTSSPGECNPDRGCNADPDGD
ncbi:MAG: hypothetical protein AAGD01_04045 [Acidobacteriota bacterium]